MVSAEPDRIRTMSTEARLQLRHDIAEFGAIAVSLSRDEMRDELGLPKNRAERLRAWVLRHGALDPVGRGPLPVENVPDKPSGGKTHLIIGDAHAQPGQSLDRFVMLGKLISYIDPDEVISLGDWRSMDSLCEQRPLIERVKDNTKEELDTGTMALSLVEANLEPGLKCRKHITLGNHDVRPEKIAKDMPWLANLVDVGEAFREQGWKVTPFGETMRLDGIAYQHYLTGRGTGRPISGKFHALRLLERVLFGESVVVGHSHMFQHYTTAVAGRRVHGLVAGCYMDHMEDYAGRDNHDWWRGIIVLRNVVDGNFDLEVWSMERIRAMFAE